MEIKKKKILIVNPGKLTSITDNLFYVKHLGCDFDLFYFGILEGDENIEQLNVNIKYISKHNNKILNKLLFLSSIKNYIKSNSFDFIFVNYFFGCSILSFLIRNKKIHLDIRTGHISRSKIKNKFYNYVILAESISFYSITCISESLIKHLNLPKKTTILPLGATKYVTKRKSFDTLKLLYVGNLNNRNIDITIIGFHNFINLYKISNITYTIIGFGNTVQVKYLNKLIDDLKLHDFVFFLGELRGDNIIKYYENNNIGISFVPITKYFNFQPPTKTYEYLLNGMPVIATNTYENSLVINELNGVLINDNIESFTEGLNYIYKNRFNYNHESILAASEKFSWNNIINNNFKKILNFNNN
jgi:glycosyltransferase involved in cell wall biosynthesis